MPIEAPSGTLDIENAKLRVSEFSVTTSIGIGTENTEKYPLYIYNDVKPEIIIQESSTSAAKFTSNNGSLTIQSGITLSDSSDGDIVFSDMGGITKHMTIKGATGDIGVGTTSPSAKLHVNGGSLKISSGSSGGLYDNGYQWLECKNASDWYRLAQTPKSSGIACYNGIAINSGGGLVVGSWDSPNTLGVGNAYFAGNVGIGILSPAYKLDVNGTLRASNAYFGNMYIGGSTSRGLCSVSGSYGTVQTTGGGAGNYEGYSIDGRYVFMSADNNGCGIYNDLDNEWMIFCARNSHTTLYFDGGEKLATTTTGVSITGDIAVSSNLTVGTANLHVDTLTGRVGVGTNTPGYTLDVNGNINISSGNTYKINGNDVQYLASVDAVSVTTGTAGTDASVTLGGTPSAATLSFTIPRGAAGAKGDQGIQGIQGPAGAKGDQGIQGIQGPAGAKGDQGIQGIQGPAGAKGDQGIQGIQGPAGAKGDRGIQGIQGPAGADGDAFFTQSGTNAYYNTGNFGLGTADPKCKLHVSGAICLESEDLGAFGADSISDAANRTKTYIKFAHGGTSNDWAYLRQIGGSNGNHIALDFHDDGNDAGFSIRDVKSTDNPDTVTTRFIVQRGGNVGIGTTSPAYKLDVHGTSNVGTLTATSGTFTGTVTAPTFSGNATSATSAGYATSAGSAATATNADTVDDLHASSFLRSDTSDTVGAGVTYSWAATNMHGLSFKNSSYNTYLNIGGWTSSNTNNISRIRNSSGNLHIDSAANGNLYLNWYTGGSIEINSTLNSSGYIYANSGARINRLLPYSSSYGAGYNVSAIEVREYNLEGSAGGTEWARAPRIGFHWSGRVASQIMMDSGGTIMAVNNPGTGYANFNAHHIYCASGMSAVANGASVPANHSTNWSDHIYLNNYGRRWSLGVESTGSLAMGFFGWTSSNGGTRYLNGYVHGTIYGNRMNFTGQHRTFVENIPHKNAIDYEGLIVSANKNRYIKMSDGVEHGNKAITVNESLPVVSLSNTCMDKSCFGVISSSEDPETRSDAYGKFVSVFEKELGDTRIYINSVGEGAIWVTNINGDLESGDYITTSNITGYGQKQTSDSLKNYTVAKITMDCDFKPIQQPVKRIIKHLGNVNYWVKTTEIPITENEYNTTDESARNVTYDSNNNPVYKRIEIREERKDPNDESYELEIREEMVNVLDENNELQWEDTDEMEPAYKIRYLTSDGTQTDEANAVHIAAFVGCTYHCG